MNQNEMMGKLVVFTAYYRRHKQYTGRVESIATQLRTECAPQQGWITGYRFLPEGTTFYGDADWGTEFRQRGGVNCVLIVRNPRENPLRVPLDAFREMG